MGCGSSRRVQAINSTPIQNSTIHSKDMVLPGAWMSQTKKAVPISANASAQTDACSRMSDTDVQTDIELTPIMGWDTRDVETQTPVDEGFDSLDRILAKADQFLMIPSKYRSDPFATDFVDASVQTTYDRAEESTQTDPIPLSEVDDPDVKENGSFDSIFTDISNKNTNEDKDIDLFLNSTKMLSMESQTEPVNKGAVRQILTDDNTNNSPKASVGPVNGSKRNSFQGTISEAAKPYVVETFWESLEKEVEAFRPSYVGLDSYKPRRILGEPYDLVPMKLLDSSVKDLEHHCQTCIAVAAKAANTADSEAAGVLYMSELLSPFAHLEKELGTGHFDDSRRSKDAVQDGITRLLMDVEDSLSKHAILDYTLKMNLREIGVQTDNDPITDEAPEYAARPPPCKKQEMIPDMSVFEEIDKHAIEAPESTKSSLRNLINYLCAAAENELFKVRAFFRWISNNITYDWKYMDVKQGADQVLVQGEGVCKDYCKLFGEMCK
ncbi:TGc domain-containing protein [Trichonephila clavata]|uniref:TGc domain-containing protein n=1 Tax=Trichonephila clavata TaxID=2740835 RepID=A0A8X6L7V3_TRICU|nr:TGc domain-containing protein [Trichonephila clavata]